MSIRASVPSTLAAAIVVGLFAWLSVASGTPRLWSPMPLAIVLPLLWAEPFLNRDSIGKWSLLNVLPEVLGCVLFILWNPHLLRGSAEVPRRSRFGLGLLTVLNAGALVLGWNFGVKYQGVGYTRAIIMINCLAAGLCWAALASAQRRPSFVRSLVFHCGTAIWVVWLAFPWLGELF